MTTQQGNPVFSPNGNLFVITGRILGGSGVATVKGVARGWSLTYVSAGLYRVTADINYAYWLGGAGPGIMSSGTALNARLKAYVGGRQGKPRPWPWDLLGNGLAGHALPFRDGPRSGRSAVLLLQLLPLAAPVKEPSLSDQLYQGGAPTEKGAPSLGDDEEAPPDEGGDEAAEMEVGQEMLNAIEMKDPKATYEAMKVCCHMGVRRHAHTQRNPAHQRREVALRPDHWLRSAAVHHGR